jgi:streptomycin 6-kinase
MDSLHDYLQLWGLREPVLLAQRATSNLYTAWRDGEKVVLKLLTPVGVADEADGAAALRYFDGEGAVRLLASDERAHLLEYAGDEELAERVVRGDDLRAAAIIGDVLNQLHRPRPAAPMPPLRTLPERFASLFERAARDAAAGVDSIYRRGALVAGRLLAQPREQVVLHGDIQHHNIRLHPTRGWLSYDPKGLYGERLYDTANAVCNPSSARDLVLSAERLLRVSQVIADEIGADRGRLRAFVFAYACLSASWPDKPEGGEVQQWFLTVARNAERSLG